MRCLKVLSIVVPSLVLGGAVAAGCATDDGEKLFFATDAGTDGNGGRPDVTTHYDAHTGGMDATTGFDNFVPPPPPFDSPMGSEAATSNDAGYDGGLVFFGNPGTACTTLGAMQAQACGRCGMQTSTCIKRPDGGVPYDAGVDAGEDSGHDAGLDAGHMVSHDAGATDGEAHDGRAHDGEAEDGQAHDASAHDGEAHDGGAHDATTGEHDGSADAEHEDSATHEAGPKDAGKDAKEAGPPPQFVWSEWSACTGEIDGGCLPGTQTVQSCGACGKQTVICEPDCELGATNCEGQVAGGCIPGTVEFTPVAACATDGGIAGKTESCGATCQWDASATCEAPPSTLTIAPSGSGEVNTFVNFTAANEKPLVNLTEFICPTTLTNGMQTPFGFVTVQNSSMTQMAVVSVWTSQAPHAPQIDTAITAYAAMPANNSGLKNCEGVVTDTCMDMSDPTSCLGSYGGLMIGDGNAVTIPAGGTVVIFVQDQFNDAADLGAVEVTVRTEAFM
jgi:hypothetical protein